MRHKCVSIMIKDGSHDRLKFTLYFSESTKTYTHEMGPFVSKVRSRTGYKYYESGRLFAG